MPARDILPHTFFCLLSPLDRVPPHRTRCRGFRGSAEHPAKALALTDAALHLFNTVVLVGRLIQGLHLCSARLKGKVPCFQGGGAGLAQVSSLLLEGC